MIFRSGVTSRKDTCFPPEQLTRLLDAVLNDDEVDAHTALPDRIELHYDEALLADCFRLCRQLWAEGVSRTDLIALLDCLRVERDLDAEDRYRFKIMRAKLKHFRFACALYGERHTYPILTDWLTTALGHVQDAFRNGQDRRVVHKSIVARLLLLRGWPLLIRERDQVVLTSSEGFRAYLLRETRALDAAVARPKVTGAQFHATRKVASRLVSFYDTLRTLKPSQDALLMSRSLAAINGLMGTMHDELVERRAAGLQDYYREQFALPSNIRYRIIELVDRFRLSNCAVGTPR